MTDATAAQRERLVGLLDRVARAQIGAAVVIGLMGLASCGIVMAPMGGPCPGLPDPAALGVSVLIWSVFGGFMASGTSLWGRLGRRSGGYARPLLTAAGFGLAWGAGHAAFLVVLLVRSAAQGQPGGWLWGEGPWLDALLRLALFAIGWFATALPFFIGLWSGWTWYRWRALLE